MERPHSDDFRVNYNPVRWVCQYRAGNCDGTFYISGYKDAGRQPCPLFDKCGGRDPQLEFFHLERHAGLKVLHTPADAMRTRRHTVENSALERCFFGERDKTSYENRRDAILEVRRATYRAQDLMDVSEKRRAEYEEKQRLLGRKVRRWPELVPPCGGDCENCPYPDGECRYEDWDQSKERRRLNDQRKKQRRRSDPVYREHRREIERRSRAKRLADETPEQREGRLARKREYRRRKKKGEGRT